MKNNALDRLLTMEDREVCSLDEQFEIAKDNADSGDSFLENMSTESRNALYSRVKAEEEKSNKQEKIRPVEVVKPTPVTTTKTSTKKKSTNTRSKTTNNSQEQALLEELFGACIVDMVDELKQSDYIYRHFSKKQTNLLLDYLKTKL